MSLDSRVTIAFSLKEARGSQRSMNHSSHGLMRNSNLSIGTALLAFSLTAFSQSPTATVRIEVKSEEKPVTQAEVRVNDQVATTGADGTVTISVSLGTAKIVVSKNGFLPVQTSISVDAARDWAVRIELKEAEAVKETVTVYATRNDLRIQDSPIRVEVLQREEIEEKMLMSPGDIAMMLNEMGGMRVQTSSPSLGSASVRVQGMRGRYTRFLSDGLPLFGAEVGGLGLLQIPPTDLGQVEVIKGVASALYGAGALGGVVDLISRRPGEDPIREALVNRTTRGGTDAVLFAAQPVSKEWSGTLLVG